MVTELGIMAAGTAVMFAEVGVTAIVAATTGIYSAFIATVTGFTDTSPATIPVSFPITPTGGPFSILDWEIRRLRRAAAH